MNEPENPEELRSEDGGGHRAYDPPRPFDISELEQIPPITEEDPPYRQWWVVGAGE